MKRSDDTSHRRNSPKVFTWAVVAAVVGAVAILTVLLSSRPVATADEPVNIRFYGCAWPGGSQEVPTGADINVWSGWIAHKRGMIKAYLSAVDLSITVDGTPIPNANDLHGPIVDAGDVDGDGDSEFATYWNLTLDPLEAGQKYVIESSVDLTHPIIDTPGGDYDGDGRPDRIGPGEIASGTCTLTAAP